MVGVSAQKFDIADLDRPQPADRLDNPRYHDGAAGAPAHGRRGVEINPREGRRKAIRIALATDLAGDDVDPGTVFRLTLPPARRWRNQSSASFSALRYAVSGYSAWASDASAQLVLRSNSRPVGSIPHAGAARKRIN